MSIATYTKKPPKPKTKVDGMVFKLVYKMLNDETITYENDFYLPVKITKQHYQDIRVGRRSFTVAHIAAICRKYKINANWLLGIEKNMHRL